MVEVSVIGFGEAGMALTPAGARGFDVRQDERKRNDFRHCGVLACATAAEALSGATVVLSLVTADQALAAAKASAPNLASETLCLDLNNVSPDTKRAAAAFIEGAGGRYVDVAVMAAVLPARRGVPLLVAGPYAEAGLAALADIEFSSVRVVAGPVGAAAAIKMIRSVMIKGIEALSAECALAAEAAGVLPEVLASLGDEWAGQFDYNLNRMLVHGTRRAAEMREVVATLDALGTGSAMARATQDRQAALGALDLSPPPGLTAKLDALLGRHKEETA